MASKKRLSVWGTLARVGLTGDHDAIIEHVFEMTSRTTLRSDHGEPMDGGDFLCEVFDLLGTTKNWPACGSSDWIRLREIALRKVVARLARDGLLDAIAVGCATDTEGKTDNPATKGEDSASGSGLDSADATDGEGESDAETPTTDDGSTDPRIGVQVFRSYFRRGRRNPDGWFRGVDRMTPYKAIARWASQNCPGVATESLVALLDGLREVRWWDDDGHIIGGEMLRVLESELEAGCDHEQWMCVVSDFEAAIGRLRSVFEKLSLL